MIYVNKASTVIRKWYKVLYKVCATALTERKRRIRELCFLHFRDIEQTYVSLQSLPCYIKMDTKINTLSSIGREHRLLKPDVKAQSKYHNLETSRTLQPDHYFLFILPFQNIIEVQIFHKTAFWSMFSSLQWLMAIIKQHFKTSALLEFK